MAQRPFRWHPASVSLLEDHARTPAESLPDEDRASFSAGVRAGVPFALAGFLLSLSFGVLAHDAGFPAIAAVVMSLIVFAGSAQFAAVSILAAGGGVGAAVGAAALMNARFLPMGVALAPSLPGRALWRAAQGQSVVDSSWALSSRGDGSFDRWFLFGCSGIQYVTWALGTVVGVAGGSAIGDPHALGLDAIYPAFFLAILIAELRADRAGGGQAPKVAAAGALVALALVPLTPPGVPVLAASVVALVGLRAGQGCAAGSRHRGRRGPHARLPPPRPSRLRSRATRMTATAWATIAGCAVVTVLIKGAGPVAFGGRDLPRRFANVVVLLAPALLAALIVTSALADNGHLKIGEDTAGVGVAGVALWRGASVLIGVTLAAGVTAGLRLLT